MTDFFADLEQQLIGATAERARRVRRARARRSATLATVLLAIVAGGAGLATALAGSDGDHGAPAAPTPTTAPHTIATAPPTAPTTTYTVAVLNGTSVPGLARGVANVLQNRHFKIGNVTNAADQTRSATAVQYAPGHRAEATQVAETIDARATALHPIDRASRTIAGRQAEVVVLVGSDLNTSRRP
jgi:hypothetical protein